MKITSEPVWQGKRRNAIGFKFVVIDGTRVSLSLRIFQSARAAVAAGKREFR